MRRITIWLVAALSVAAMATYYQVSLSGDGKADTRPAAEQSEGSAAEPPGTTTEDETSAEDDKADDPDADSDHTGKPGEAAKD